MFASMFAFSLSKDSNRLILSTDTFPKFPALLACHRLFNAAAIVIVVTTSFLILRDPTCAPKSKGCKPCAILGQSKMHGLHGDGFHVIEKGSMWTYVNLDVPSLYGTGCARSDFTTCLPVPWRGWRPLVRIEQAVLRVLNFEGISVLTCLATAV